MRSGEDTGLYGLPPDVAWSSGNVECTSFMYFCTEINAFKTIRMQAPNDACCVLVGIYFFERLKYSCHADSAVIVQCSVLRDASREDWYSGEGDGAFGRCK